MKKQLNLHLISDSTGETITFISKAVLSQFPEMELKEFHHFLIRNEATLNKTIQSIKENSGLVLYTILNDELVKILKLECTAMNIPFIDPLTPIIKEFASFIGIENIKTIGKQHEISTEYYNKIEAINYTLNHDDGNLANDLTEADIIILGVSRSSKSPTSVYLAYKGYKVGNIPFVKAELIPKYIENLKKPLIVGFTIDPERLQSIRQSRIKTLEMKEDTDYTDIETIKEEVREAKKFFSKLGIPIINVTEKSIEETSVYVINLLEERNKR